MPSAYLYSKQEIHINAQRQQLMHDKKELTRRINSLQSKFTNHKTDIDLTELKSITKQLYLLEIRSMQLAARKHMDEMFFLTTLAKHAIYRLAIQGLEYFPYLSHIVDSFARVSRQQDLNQQTEEAWRLHVLNISEDSAPPLKDVEDMLMRRLLFDEEVTALFFQHTGNNERLDNNLQDTLRMLREKFSERVHVEDISEELHILWEKCSTQVKYLKYLHRSDSKYGLITKAVNDIAISSVYEPENVMNTESRYFTQGVSLLSSRNQLHQSQILWVSLFVQVTIDAIDTDSIGLAELYDYERLLDVLKKAYERKFYLESLSKHENSFCWDTRAAGTSF